MSSSDKPKSTDMSASAGSSSTLVQILSGTALLGTTAVLIRTGLLSSFLSYTQTALCNYLFPPAVPKVDFLNGVGVIVRQGSQILIGRRLNSVGEQLYAVPGGRLEPGETFIGAAVRELQEETGITLQYTPKQAYVFPATHEHGQRQYKHNKYIDLASHLRSQTTDSSAAVAATTAAPSAVFEGGSIEVYCPEESCQLIVHYVIIDMPQDQVPQLLETHKCESWHWVEWDDIAALARYDHHIAQQTLFDTLSQDQQRQFGEMQAQTCTVVSSQQSQNTSAIQHDQRDTSKTVSEPPSYDVTLAQQPRSTSLYVDTNGRPVVEFPRMSEKCILRPGIDHLFGPFQALAAQCIDSLPENFNPCTAQLATRRV